MLSRCFNTSCCMRQVGEVLEYLEQGPGFIFLYHPALGPLWDVIGQKVHFLCRFPCLSCATWSICRNCYSLLLACLCYCLCYTSC